MTRGLGFPDVRFCRSLSLTSLFVCQAASSRARGGAAALLAPTCLPAPTAPAPFVCLHLQAPRPGKEGLEPQRGLLASAAPPPPGSRVAGAGKARGGRRRRRPSTRSAHLSPGPPTPGPGAPQAAEAAGGQAKEPGPPPALVGGWLAHSYRRPKAAARRAAAAASRGRGGAGAKEARGLRAPRPRLRLRPRAP